jgi:hypothetical protein
MSSCLARFDVITGGMICSAGSAGGPAVLHRDVGAEPSACRRLGHCLRRSCRHWHVEGSLGIASQTATRIEFFEIRRWCASAFCMPVKDAKPMRKMHDLAGAGSLPVTAEARGTLDITLTVRVAGAAVVNDVIDREAKCCRPSSKGGVDHWQFCDYGTKPRGKTSYLLGYSRHSSLVPIFQQIRDGDGGASPIPDNLKSGTGTGERPRPRANRRGTKVPSPSPGKSGTGTGTGTGVSAPCLIPPSLILISRISRISRMSLRYPQWAPSVCGLAP